MGGAKVTDRSLADVESALSLSSFVGTRLAVVNVRMRLRLSLIVLAGLFACTSSEEEDTSSEGDGSSGLEETNTGGPSSSGDPTSPTATSTTGAPTGEPTTAVTTTGTGESGATTGPLPTGDSAASESSSGTATSGEDETSAAETGGDEGPSAQCVELEACCDEIGSALFAGCISVVQMESPELCDSILTNYHQEGYCTGETFCAELGDCCPELPPGPGWQDTCEYYADFGNQPQCAMLIGDYQLSDYCL